MIVASDMHCPSTVAGSAPSMRTWEPGYTSKMRVNPQKALLMLGSCYLSAPLRQPMLAATAAGPPAGQHCLHPLPLPLGPNPAGTSRYADAAAGPARQTVAIGTQGAMAELHRMIP